MLAASQLRGLPYERAELFGKPSIGAEYTGGARYERTQPRCAVCGRPATNVHHLAGRGGFDLDTPRGSWRLRSPLIALCGSGTTGCHDGFHGGAWLTIRWAWDDESSKAAWWDGRLLEALAPHDPRLYAFGCWLVEVKGEQKPRVLRGSIGESEVRLLRGSLC